MTSISIWIIKKKDFSFYNLLERQENLHFQYSVRGRVGSVILPWNEPCITKHSVTIQWEGSVLQGFEHRKPRFKPKFGHLLAFLSCKKLYNLTGLSHVHSCSFMSNSLRCMDCSPPGSSIHGILLVRILEKVAIFSSRGSSEPKYWTRVSSVSCIAGGCFITELFPNLQNRINKNKFLWITRDISKL